MLSVQTHLLHNFLEGSDVSGRVAVFFLQSRSVVLDWGHTPGEHAQCHKTRNSHIEIFHVLFGLMAAGPLLPIYAGVHHLTEMLAIVQERMLGAIGFGQCYSHSKSCFLRETASSTCI